MYNNFISGTFTSATAGASDSFTKYFNLNIQGTFVATITLERSFDQGLTWNTLATDSTGTATAFTAPLSLIAYEPENNVRYRLNCTSYTSGTVTWRLSQ
jgi:hypothetical protein